MIVVADAGPILHLYWIDGSSWALPPQDIFVVDEVWVEIEKFAPAALEDPRLLRAAAPASSLVDAKRLHLDPGEAAAIAFAMERSGSLLLTDDEAARRACAELKITVTGSIGLIVEAVRAGRATREVGVSALEALPARGRLYVSAALLARAVAALGGPI